jgi:hypothetical protein
MSAALAKRLFMVELEPLRLPATHSATIDVRTTAAVAFENRAAYLGRHGAAALAFRIARRAAFRAVRRAAFRIARRAAFRAVRHCFRLARRRTHDGSKRVRASTGSAPGLLRHGVATLLEVRHQRSHRAHVKIFERGVRNGVRQ